MPAQYLIQSSTLTNIADAIRLKLGASDPIAASEFAENIIAIPTGSGGGTVNWSNCIPTEEYNGSTLASYSNSTINIVNANAFAECSSLSAITLDSCKCIEYGAFRDCVTLTDVSLPTCERIGPVAFYECSALSSITLPTCTMICYLAFAYCENLESVYLLAPSLCHIDSPHIFDGGPMFPDGTQTGKIYVPSTLYSRYRNASEWSYYRNCFVSYVSS